MSTAAPETDIVFAPAPGAMIKRLLPLITTDATIANYVNAHFGTKIPVSRVAELRRNMPKVVVTDHGSPIADASTQVKASATDSSFRLLRAIRQHHPDKAA